VLSKELVEFGEELSDFGSFAGGYAVNLQESPQGTIRQGKPTPLVNQKGALFARGPPADAFVCECKMLRLGNHEVATRIELHRGRTRAEVAHFTPGLRL
jgi:acyl-coenzyme A thioesterase PaaI-like protein